MKKLLAGTFWFVIVIVILNLMLAIIFYFYSGQEYSSFDSGYDAGQEIGSSFYDNGGRVFMHSISAILAGILTYKEILPFSKSKVSKENDQSE